MLGKDYPDQSCSLARALEVIGERWTLLILRDAFFGVRRFSDFAVHIDLPRAVLSDRLRGLVEHGLLVRKPDPDRAGREVYELTEDGRALWPALHALLRWGARFQETPRKVRRYLHDQCNVQLDAAGRCPRCDRIPPAREVATVGPGAGPTRDDPVSAALQPRRMLLEPLTP